MLDLHATLSGTKAFWTWDVAIAIEIARMACGGHGFSNYSGIPCLYNEFSANCTLEGENSVMALQTARYLVKTLNTVRKGKFIPENVEYLKSVGEVLSEHAWTGTEVNDLNVGVVEKMLKANAGFLVFEAAQKLIEGTEQGLSMKETWDKKAGMSLVEAARAHTVYFTFKSFLDDIPSAKEEKSRVVLKRLCELYGLHQLIKFPLGLLESGFVKPEQVKLLKLRKEKLLELVRPDALGLVESYMYNDNNLKSAIGRSDGKVYETLWEWANTKNNFGEKEVQAVFEKSIKPLRYINRPSPKL